MPASATSGPRVIPVQQLRPGDHAFLDYDDEQDLWDLVTAFAWHGLARGEKVMVLADPALPGDEVLRRLDAPGPLIADACARGQLSVGSMRGLIHPDETFTADRQMGRLEEETGFAAHEGYTGLRTFIDMHWVPDLGGDIDPMIHRETHADHLFTGQPYTEICAYDRRWFTPDVLDAMRDAHPCRIPGTPGDLHTVRLSGTV